MKFTLSSVKHIRSEGQIFEQHECASSDFKPLEIKGKMSEFDPRQVARLQFSFYIVLTVTVELMF